jgi:hypothetical protein
MKIARVVRNVILAGMAWRLIVLRRGALARERRARRIVPLVIVAAGTGMILTTRPRIVGGVRRLWGRRPSNGETSSVVREPQPDVEMAPERKKSLPRKPAPVRPRRTGKDRALAGTEPKPGVKH